MPDSRHRSSPVHARPPHRQDPASQVSWGWQARPHIPQWLASVSGSTHSPSQSMSPSGHAQPPLRHSMPAPQARSHPPQCAGSLTVSTHALPQRISPAAQDTTQSPAAQTWPVAHSRPQDPQCCGSLAKLTQRPSQVSIGALQAPESEGMGLDGPEQPAAAASAAKTAPRASGTKTLPIPSSTADRRGQPLRPRSLSLAPAVLKTPLVRRVLALVVMLGFPLAGCPKAGGPPADRAQLTDPQLQRGQEVFLRYCNRCHPGGEAGTGPELVREPPLAAEEIRSQVRTGMGMMPSFRESQIPEGDLDALVAYLHSLSG